MSLVNKQIYKNFINLMHLLTKDRLLYINKLHQHIDSIAIGCPLAPTIANFLLEHMKTIMLEKKHLITTKRMLGS